MQGFRRRSRSRALAPTLAITAITALMALAGPAAATGGWHGEDDDPAGTIASYDGETGKLVIDLTDGDSISGVVTGRTWIDDGERGCDGGGDGSKAKRGAKAARHGDWCDGRKRLNGDHERGGDHGWRQRGDESDLVEGAVVENAILVLKDGKAWYAKVALD